MSRPALREGQSRGNGEPKGRRIERTNKTHSRNIWGAVGWGEREVRGRRKKPGVVFEQLEGEKIEKSLVTVKELGKGGRANG